jgi:hypothetical protein
MAFKDKFRTPAVLPRTKRWLPLLCVQPHQTAAYRVWAEVMVATGKRSEHPRGMPLVTRMHELQASTCGNQWHPRVQISVEKCAPYQHAVAIPGVGCDVTERGGGERADTRDAWC